MKKTTTKRSRQHGYALLEYSAGAAVVATVLWLAMSNMGSSIGSMLDSIGTWAEGQASSISSQLDTSSTQ